jgi:hypothetical protein
VIPFRFKEIAASVNIIDFPALITTLLNVELELLQNL